MIDFSTWLGLLAEDNSDFLLQDLLGKYEVAYRAVLQELLRRTTNSVHRQEIEAAMARPQMQQSSRPGSFEHPGFGDPLTLPEGLG